MAQATPVITVDPTGAYVAPGGGGGGPTTTVNLTQVGGSPISMGAQSQSGGIPIAFPTDQALSISGGIVTASGSVALLAGTAIIGKVGIDQTTPGTTNAVQITGSLPTGANTIGAVTSSVATSGGCAVSRNIIPNNTTAIVVKSGAGQLYAIAAYNSSAAIAWIKIYNATSATAGSGTPFDGPHMIPAPAAGGGGGIIWHVAAGVAYSTGITFIVTTGIADNDTGVPSAATYTVLFYYK